MFFDNKTLFDDKAGAQRLISVEIREMHTVEMRTFQLEIYTFHFKIHKFPFKFVSVLGVGEWRLPKKTYEMSAFHAIQ